MLKVGGVLVTFIALSTSVPIKIHDDPSCQSCHPVDPNKLNVHLIPHSHDDVGWLKTVDQYFYGLHSDIQRAGVQYIISSTVESLKRNPDRRFIQVETAFLTKWWERQSNEIRQDFVDLVNNGQIEIINAGWSMNDEAATNYHSTIDQFTLGLRHINDTIGKCGIPRIGWQIDPFGHSREQASIFARLGYDGIFFARLDHDDKNQRIADQTMEVIWRGSANLNNTDIFTNIFPQFYFPPGGFCFDINCGDEVLVDDTDSEDYNVPRKVHEFEKQMNDLSKFYQTNNLIIPMGGDFQYQAAEKNFINTDKLIKGFENHETINLIYSTPSCYIKAVNDAAALNKIEFPIKADDFFPYASSSHDFWTGYFTSRPNAKRSERLSNNILQAANQLASFSKVNGDDVDSNLRLLSEALGILQHHDAITGTAKQQVAKDYARLLDVGIRKVEPIMSAVITNLLKIDSSSDIDLNLKFCLLSNMSICEPATSDRFVVSVYNPLERAVKETVRIPVPDGTYRITSDNGEEDNDLFDSISSFDYVKDIDGTPSLKELVFVADLSPMSISLYYIERTGDETPSKESIQREKPQVRFGTDQTGFEIDENTGLLSSVTINGITKEISQEFRYYNSFNGTNDDDENRASGAYIFRPLQNESFPVFQESVEVSAVTGKLVDEVHQKFNDWITQIIRVNKVPDVGSNYIEFDWLVGPIDVDMDNEIGKEIISKFTLTGDFDNEESFYTDSNGREMIKRTVNQRSDYEYDSTNEPIASNYYPITSKITIKDRTQNQQVSILNDRAQGGTSLKNGEIELMLHRRTLKDDVKGVSEPLNDTEFDQGVVARGQLYLTLGPIENDDTDQLTTTANERILALEKLLAPVVLVADASSTSLDQLKESVNFAFTGINSSPNDVIHILTLQPWQDDSYILRVEHILEKEDDSVASITQSVDIENLFTLFKVTEVQEATLGANQWLNEFHGEEKYVWKLKNGELSTYTNTYKTGKDDSLTIRVDPMEIRTFIIKVQKN